MAVLSMKLYVTAKYLQQLSYLRKKTNSLFPLLTKNQAWNKLLYTKNRSFFLELEATSKSAC